MERLSGLACEASGVKRSMTRALFWHKDVASHSIKVIPKSTLGYDILKLPMSR